MLRYKIFKAPDSRCCTWAKKSGENMEVMKNIFRDLEDTSVYIDNIGAFSDEIVSIDQNIISISEV